MSTPLFANEHEMVDSIVSAATDLGWMVYHHRPARTARTKMVRDRFTGQMVEKQIWETALQGHAGFPDLMLTKHGCLAFVECKMDGNKPSPAQKKWLDWLELIPSLNVHVLTLYPAGYDAFIDWLARDVLGEMLAPVRYKSVKSSRTVETVKGGSPAKAMFPGQVTAAANAKTFIVADAKQGMRRGE